MKCILDLNSGINYRVEVQDKDEFIMLTIVKDENKKSVFLSVNDANDLAEMLKQVSIQAQQNQF